MTASDHLQPLQFEHYTEHGDTYHVLEAHHPQHGEVGYMIWAGQNTDTHKKGEISNIQVHEPYQRQGVGTALYQAASNYGPTPLHSKALTKKGGGAAFAKAVGGPAI